MEATILLDQPLADLERSGGTISGERANSFRTELGWWPLLIVSWRPCESLTEAKGFLGLCVYYQRFCCSCGSYIYTNSG